MVPKIQTTEKIAFFSFNNSAIGWRRKIIFFNSRGVCRSWKIENVYAKCKSMAQCFICGGSFNSCLVAVVVVETEILKAWAAAEQIQMSCADDPNAVVVVMMVVLCVAKLKCNVEYTDQMTIAVLIKHFEAN
ncbi:hypothetical protein IEQ34_006024 [Dendrobium chrysotoxum]|uniref:Uncharacterized protein n=1 Tax=Dendrobium chrysotoxum TaxID=161865 RepID=A0AAV7HBC5_DENCH|nr:hypothetical protein IEQ34_006024 [Dendrobium chrysotoxum]